MKESINLLKDYRFNISENSLELMKKERAYLQEQQKKIPELAGLTFFGSRTLGREKESSDLDMNVFYDSSDCWKEQDGELKPDQDKIAILENRISKVFDVDSIEEEYKEHAGTSLYDISPGAIKRDLKRFQNLLKDQESGVRKEFTPDFKPTEAWNIMSLFLLGVGDRLYKARNEILNTLEKLPDGEFIWGKIVDYVSAVERDGTTKKREALESYNMYPRTISKARDYFRVIADN